MSSVSLSTRAVSSIAATHPRLEALLLVHLRVGEQALLGLRELQHLRYLGLHGGGALLHQIAQLHKLQGLQLDVDPAEAAGLHELSSLTALTRLSIGSTTRYSAASVMPGDLAWLQHLPRMSKLGITGFLLHDPAIRTLASLAALTDLEALLQLHSDLSHLSCTWQRLQLLSTSPQYLLYLPRSPSLRLIDSEMRWTLPGSGDPEATAQQVTHAAELLVNIWDGTTLHLNWSQPPAAGLTRRVLSALQPLMCMCGRLQLGLRKNWRLDSSLALQLSKTFPSLAYLSVNPCAWDFLAFIRALGSCWPGLASLRLSTDTVDTDLWSHWSDATSQALLDMAAERTRRSWPLVVTLPIRFHSPREPLESAHAWT